MRYRIALFSTILLCPIVPLTALTCTKDSSSPCKCELGDGATGTIDFSPLFSSGKLTASGGSYSYTLDGCSKNSDCSGCSGDCLVCQVSSDGKNKFGIGSASDVTFDVSQSDPANNLWKVVVSYADGQQQRQSKVEYDHSTTTGMTFEQEHPELTYNLKVTGPFIAPSSGGGGNSGAGSSAADIAGVPGIVIIIVLIAAMVAYIVIGIAVNAGVRHKRGVEMMPNLEFWKDFPFLLKDGVVFTFMYPCNAIKNRSVKYDNV